MVIDFILPNQKSESLKKVEMISPKLGGFNYFIEEPVEPVESEEAIYSIENRRFRTIMLVRVKHQLPAPRVWTQFEYLMHVPPRYIYNVWMDSYENPQHYWAGAAELETWNSREKHGL